MGEGHHAGKELEEGLRGLRRLSDRGAGERKAAGKAGVGRELGWRGVRWGCISEKRGV